MFFSIDAGIVGLSFAIFGDSIAMAGVCWWCFMICIVSSFSCLGVWLIRNRNAESLL